MPHPESSAHQKETVTEEEAILAPDESTLLPEASELGAEDTPTETPKSNAKFRWLLPLVALLLLVGGGFGWYFFQRSQKPQTAEAPSAAQPQAVPVKLTTVEIATVQDSSEFVGALQAPRSVEMKPEIEGRVSQILVLEGDRVVAGTPLIQLSQEKRQADLESLEQAVNVARASRARAVSEIQALEAEKLSLAADLNLQETNYRRISSLVQQGAIARAELDRVTRDRAYAQAQLNAINQRIEAAKATVVEEEARLQQAQANVTRSREELSDATVNAPFAGVVGDIPVKLGEFVSKGDILTTITQNDILEVELAIPIERATELSLYQKVEGLDPQGNVIATGTISFIAPQVNTNSQSLLAKASFDNAQGKLRDGQFLQTKVIWNEREGVLIPATAINRLGGQTFIYVAETQGESSMIAKQKVVKLGNIQGNNYQVLEGLTAGEQLITSGILNLSDGVPIMPESAKP